MLTRHVNRLFTMLRSSARTFQKVKSFKGGQVFWIAFLFQIVPLSPCMWGCNSFFSIFLLECQFVWVIAWFVVIFGINTMSDISKLLLHIILWAVRRVKLETILKYHEWYLCQISRTNHAIICLYYCPQKVCNFHM